MLGSPNTCILRVGKQRIRALINISVEMFILKTSLLQTIKQNRRVYKKRTGLQAVNREI